MGTPNPRLMALPALRDYAESEERDFYSLDVSIRGTSLGRWERMDRGVKHICVTARLTLLSDLTRPASRDAVARLVAEAVGLTCGATAPEFAHYLWGWQLGSPSRSRGFCGLGPSASSYYILIPGIHDVADPAEALTLIALAVLGAADAR